MRDKDTSVIWSTLLNLLSIVVFLVVCLLLYLPTKPFLKESIYNHNRNKASFKSGTISNKSGDRGAVKNGIHLQTGLYFDGNLIYIQKHCMGCHSPKLIAQNRADRQGWKSMIRWMQDTQGLHDLGVDEPKVLDYLSKHYKPQKVGRRPNLDMEDIEWYVLQK